MSHLLKGGDGHLRRAASGHLVKQSIPLSRVRIAGYADGDIIGCFTCISCDQFPIIWDGTFPRFFPPCGWGPVISLELCIPGPAGVGNNPYKDLSGDTAVHHGGEDPGEDEDWWEIYIACSPSPLIIWRGRKFTGSDPTGVYTRIEGCDNTPNLTIESY